MRRVSTKIVKLLILSIIISFFNYSAAIAAAPQKVLYVLTSEYAVFERGELTLKGIPAVLHFSDRQMNESGYMSVSGFTKKLHSYLAKQDSNGQTAALSIYNDDGATNVILKFKEPYEIDGVFSLEAEVAQGYLPPNIDTSTLFIVMLEPSMGGS